MKNYLLYDIATIYGREMKHFMKQKSSLFMGIVQPILWFLFMGFGMNALIGFNPHASTVMGVANYITYVLPGIITMTAMCGGLFGGASICNDIKFGYINKMLSSPISRSAIVLGKISSSVIQTCFQAIIVFIFALCFGVEFRFSLNSLWAIIFFAAFCAQMCAISIIVSVIFKNHQVVYSFLGTLNVPLMFTCNAFFPKATMPNIMRIFSYVNPLTYAINSIREVMFEINNNLFFNVSILFVETVMFITFSLLIFKKEYDG